MIRWTMSLAEIEARVAGLRALALNNPAAATADAAELRIDVLRAIADGSAEDPARFAAAALVTIDEGLGPRDV